MLHRELRLFLLQREHSGDAGGDVGVVEVACDFLTELEQVVVDGQEQEWRCDDVEVGTFDAVPFLVELRQTGVDLLERRHGRCADVGVAEVGFDGPEAGDRVVGLAAHGRDRHRSVVAGADVPLVHDGFAFEGAADGVEGLQRLRERAVLLLAAEGREAIAEPRPRDHEEREERHEENEQELRPEAQPREHALVSAKPTTRLNHVARARRDRG